MVLADDLNIVFNYKNDTKRAVEILKVKKNIRQE